MSGKGVYFYENQGNNLRFLQSDKARGKFKILCCYNHFRHNNTYYMGFGQKALSL